MIKVVAPHVGAWIEIQTVGFVEDVLWVAPHVGAWIEIEPIIIADPDGGSHLT